MAIISDERLTDRDIEFLISGFDTPPITESERRKALLAFTEIQSLRSQAGVSETLEGEPFGWWMSDGASEGRLTFERDPIKRHNRASLDFGGDYIETALYAHIEITEEQELMQTMARALPGGHMDDSSYSAIEDALDAIQAPMCDSGGRFLTLVQRIAALQGEKK